MSDQLLDQLVDRGKYQSDADFAEGILDGIFAKFKAVSDLKIKISTDGSFKAATETVAAAKKTQDDLSLSVKAYNGVLTTLATTQAKSNALTSDAAKQAAAAKQSLSEQNKELTLNAKVQSAANGSINEARAIVANLISQRDQLSSADENYRQKVDEINQVIDKQNEFITANTSALEKQKNNVGNYIGAIAILKPALEGATQQLKDLTDQGINSGAEYESLQKEVNLLTVIVDKQDAGFKSLNAELRANQQALQLMRQAGLEGTAAFELLRTTVNKAQDEFDDFREAQALLAKGGEAPIVALVTAAQGLVGVYGAVVSAQKAFGVENEELSKSMEKLQAVLVLLNSLQSISEVLGKREALAAGLQAGARKALSIATAAYTYVTEGATIATNAFRAALAASGVGLFVIAIVELVTIFDNLSKTQLKAAENQTKLNNTLKDYNDITGQAAEQTLKYNNSVKEGLSAQLALLETQGASFLAIQAIKQRIAEEDVTSSQEGLKALNLTADGVDKLKDRYSTLTSLIQDYEAIRVKQTQQAIKDNKDPEGATKTITAQIDAYKSERDALQARIAPADKLIQQGKDGAKSLDLLTAATKKFTDEQSANLKLDTEKNRLDKVIAANAAIEASDRHTEAERLKAIQDGSKAQIALEQANLARRLATPGLSDQETIQATQDFAAAKSKIEVDARKRTLDLTRAYDQQEYDYRRDILKLQLQDQVNADQKVIDEEKSTAQQRIDANVDLFNRQKQLAGADLQSTLHDKTTTDAQRLAAEQAYDSAVVAATVVFTETRKDIFKKADEKILADGIAAGEKRLAAIKQQYIQEKVVLDQQRADRDITDQQYNRRSAKLADQAAVDSAQIEVQNAFLKVNATKAGTAERTQAEQDLYDKVNALSDKSLKKVLDAEKAKQDAAKNTVDTIGGVYDKVTSTIGSALDNQVTAQKNAIQAQIDEVNRKKDADIEAENDTLDSASDKAAKIAVINQRAQDDNARLAQQQKDLDIKKAKFDKIVAIGNIILNTAKAIVADLETPWKIAFDAAVGAAQLAIAASAPIPTYKDGTMNHPGGPMIVGDGGRSELMELPDGSMYVTPRSNTYVPDAPAGTIVYPDARKMLGSLSANVVYSPHAAQSGSLERIMIQQTDRTIQAIENKHELHINPNFNSIMAIHQYGNANVQYIAENIQFKRRR